MNDRNPERQVPDMGAIERQRDEAERSEAQAEATWGALRLKARAAVGKACVLCGSPSDPRPDEARDAIATLQTFLDHPWANSSVNLAMDARDSLDSLKARLAAWERT